MTRPRATGLASFSDDEIREEFNRRGLRHARCFKMQLQDEDEDPDSLVWVLVPQCPNALLGHDIDCNCSEREREIFRLQCELRDTRQRAQWAEEAEGRLRRWFTRQLDRLRPPGPAGHRVRVPLPEAR